MRQLIINVFRRLEYSMLANKWAFEQMGIFREKALLFIREQMGIRTNGQPNTANT